MTGSGDLGLGFLACAKAGIEKAHVFEAVECGQVIRHVIGLAPYRHSPLKTHPGKVSENGVLELRPAAARIDIFNAHYESAPTGLFGGE